MTDHPSDRRTPDPGLETPPGTVGSAPAAALDCRHVQAALFDYLSHELGAARVPIVHEHLRHCAECRRVAAQIQATLDELSAADPAAKAPQALSARRRKWLHLALLHPALYWIYEHHRLVATVAAVIVVGALLVALLCLVTGHEPGIPIWVRPR